MKDQDRVVRAERPSTPVRDRSHLEVRQKRGERSFPAWLPRQESKWRGMPVRSPAVLMWERQKHVYGPGRGSSSS